MGKALDVFAGLIVGGVVWIILNIILSFIPIIGWIFAAIIGGYVAGRLGGGAAAAILALLAPLTFGVLSGFLVSLIPIGILRSILGGAIGVIVTLWALINLVFVGLGGYIGSKAYQPTTCPYCRNRISKGALVCSSCGRELTHGVRPAKLEILPARPTEVEILPEEKPLAVEKKPSPLDQLTAERSETLTLLNNLKKRLVEGKISEETYKELKKEFERNLEEIDQKIKELEKKREGQ